MNQKKTNSRLIRLGRKLTHWLSVIVIGIVLGLTLQFVRAWTEPTQAPPNGNVGAPINTSANPQTKAGSFTSSGNITANQFCLGGVCISAWPSGGTSATPPAPQQFRCPDLGGAMCDGTIRMDMYGGCWNSNTCWGQVGPNTICRWACYDLGCADQGLVGCPAI